MTTSPRRALVTLNYFSPFGNKLVQSGYVTPENMEKALVKSRKSGISLPQAIEELTGQLLPPELIRQYRKQQLFELKILFGVESLDPEISEVDTTQVAKLIDSLIPIDICRRYRLVPLQKQETQPPSVVVAMVDPDNLAAQDDLNRILRPHGLSLQRMVIALEDYQKIITPYLDAAAQKQAEVKTHVSSQTSRQFTDADLEIGDLSNLDIAAGETEDDADLDLALGEAKTAPIINTANKILAKALTESVSDIHVEPQEEALRVRFRKDGVLHEQARLPKHVGPAIISRFKILADLDIAERRQPQDGRIRLKFEGRKVDFRVSTIPSRYGEKIVLRILDNTATKLGLDKLITDADTLQVVREMAARPFGLILVTGPTGSGKSTTLYSILSERNEPGINICTAEDPIEYTLQGITQVQVIRDKGMDFASILRAFLRQDPDVILVGETRDRETAKTAIEAALTGHLVLTTLHTNDAAGAVSRLDEMGIEPFLISGALIGVLAQRLVRRVCTECRIPYTPSTAELARFGLSASNEGEFTFYRANALTSDQINEATHNSTLCKLCKGAGYRGRVGVYEVMQLTDRIQNLVTEGAPTDRIKETAVEDGMSTLLAYSLNLVRQGYTTFEEVERVTFTDSGLEAELKAKRKSALTCRNCGAELKQEWLDCPYCMTPRFTD